MNPKLGSSLVIGILSLALVAATLRALAQTAGESVDIRQPIEGDFYAAARDLEIGADVDGDVVLAGQRIRIAARVAGDLLAAGELLSIEGAVEDDVRAAGRRVRLAAPVAGHVVAAGANVEIDRAVTIGDWAWLAGRRIEVDGVVGRDLKAAGNDIVIRGEVGGNAQLAGQSIELGPGAVIRGDLIWRGDQEPQISEGARIDGQVIRGPAATPWSRRDGEADGRAFRLLFALSLIVTALVFHLLFPRYSIESARATRSHFWASLGLGFAFLTGVPLLLLIAFLTGIGALLGLALLAVYLLGLLAGGAAALVALGDAGLSLARRPEAGWGWRLLSFVLAMLALLLLGWTPWVGDLAVLVLWLTALGALLWQAGRQYAPPQPG